jgi:hypothetical protein
VQLVVKGAPRAHPVSVSALVPLHESDVQAGGTTAHGLDQSNGGVSAPDTQPASGTWSSSVQLMLSTMPAGHEDAYPSTQVADASGAQPVPPSGRHATHWAELLVG